MSFSLKTSRLSRTQEELMFQFETEGRKRLMSKLSQAGGNLSYSQEGQLLVVFRSSTDWMRPTIIKKGNLLLLSLLNQMFISSKTFSQTHPE